VVDTDAECANEQLSPESLSAGAASGSRAAACMSV